jgi:CheY-like chemotaxis protein
VLVVDDNKVIRQLIRVNLELEGLEVVTAADGAECLNVVHQVRPDVITLDVVMPRLDGLRTAARLRSDPRTRGLPIAIVSACAQDEVEAGLDVGVDAFLTKPFEPVALVRLVRELMARSGPGEWGDGGANGHAGLPAPTPHSVASAVVRPRHLSAEPPCDRWNRQNRPMS